MDTLQQISDGSLDDVDFPGNSQEIKQEPEEFDLPAHVDELDEKDDVKMAMVTNSLEVVLDEKTKKARKKKSQERSTDGEKAAKGGIKKRIKKRRLAKCRLCGKEGCTITLNISTKRGKIFHLLSITIVRTTLITEG